MNKTHIILLALILVTAIAGASWAQNDAHHPAEQPPTQAAPPTMSQPPQTAPGQMPQSGMMGGMMAGMPMMICPMGNMVVSGDSLYVMRGNDIFRLHKNDLRLLASTTLPMMQMQGMQQCPTPQMGGMMPGSMGAMMRPHMQEMMQRMQQMPSQQFDREFMQDMMRHHAGAITMARLAVAKADHSELRQFARNVIDDQTRENQQSANWLRQWYDTSAVATPVPQDQQFVERLQSLRGRDFEIEYMRAMMMHHNEAVNMARIAEQKAEHPELRSVASNIVTSQSKEIEQLRGWLSSWYRLDS